MLLLGSLLWLKCHVFVTIFFFCPLFIVSIFLCNIFFAIHLLIRYVVNLLLLLLLLLLLFFLVFSFLWYLFCGFSWHVFVLEFFFLYLLPTMECQCSRDMAEQELIAQEDI